MKVFINQGGGWSNEETKAFEDGTEYEPKADPRDPYDELPPEDCEWRMSRTDSWWNEFWAWHSRILEKQKKNNLTKEDQDDWKRRIEGYHQEAGTS